METEESGKVCQQRSEKSDLPKLTKIAEDLIVAVRTKDAQTVAKSLELIKDDAAKRIVMEKIPSDCVRPFLIILPELLNPGGPQTYNILRWINCLLTVHISVIVNMPDPNSVLMPIAGLLEDKSSLDYFDRVLELKGKLEMLHQMNKRGLTESEDN